MPTNLIRDIHMQNEELKAEALLNDLRLILEAAKEQTNPEDTYAVIQQAIVACELSQVNLGYETLEYVISMAVGHTLGCNAV